MASNIEFEYSHIPVKVKELDEDDVNAQAETKKSNNCFVVSWLGILALFTYLSVVCTYCGYKHKQQVHDWVPHSVKLEYGQLRSDLSANANLVNTKTFGGKLAWKHERYQLFKQAKHSCGDFESHIDPEKFDTSRWKVLEQDADANFANTSDAYLNKAPEKIHVRRSYCHAQHPERKDVTVTIERVGPFRSVGGGNWHIMEFQDQARLKSHFNNRQVYAVGGMFAPVFGNGTIIGHPPIHIHHAHMFPYGSERERLRKIRGSNNDAHDVLFQAHGDSECQKADGGIACLFHELPLDESYHIENTTTGLSGNFELNDVRPFVNTSDYELEFYMDIVLMHTFKKTAKRATYFSIGNPCFGSGPCIYTLPLDSSSSVMWFNYTHTNMGPGTWKNFVLHTHQTIFDSMRVYKGSGLNPKLEQFRKSRKLPIVLECQDMQLDETKAELFNLLDSDDTAEIVCEVTKPSLIFDCVNNNTDCHAYDKNARLQCKENIRLLPNETLTLVAFNHVRKKKGIVHGSEAFRRTNPFSHLFASYQHTILRGDFITDEGYNYSSPSYYYYAQQEYMFESSRDITQACEAKNLSIYMNGEPKTSLR
mmetsp:Transcript_20667/g.45118  ORF Transcript_20667/g.45118 Transcript_20667/m.45118 type:complete len:592 (+) Transcript_20667:43-1818(+)